MQYIIVLASKLIGSQAQWLCLPGDN
jgi:hypothetical protein